VNYPKLPYYFNFSSPYGLSTVTVISPWNKTSTVFYSGFYPAHIQDLLRDQTDADGKIIDVNSASPRQLHEALTMLAHQGRITDLAVLGYVPHEDDPWGLFEEEEEEDDAE